MSEGVIVERIPNTELGSLLGLSHVQIHRIRTGSRGASISAMVRIEECLGWSIARQVRARTLGQYAQQFEEAIGRYAEARNTSAGPENESPTPQ